MADDGFTLSSGTGDPDYQKFVNRKAIEAQVTGGTSSADPPPPTATPATSDQRQKLQSEVDTAKAAVEEHIKAVQTSRDRREQARTNYEQAQRDFRSSIDSSQVDTAPPSPIPLPQANQQQLNDHNQLGWVFPTMVGLGLLIAGSRGKHGGGTAGKFFLGGLLNGYAEGRERTRKEMRDNWWKQVEFVSKENAERLANMRAALQDKRFDLSTKMDIYRTYANEYGMAHQESGDDARDLKQAETDLQNHERALNRYDNEITKTAAAAARVTKDPEFNKYLSYVSHLYEEKMGHLPSNAQELTEARKLLSWEDWIKYTKKVGGTDVKTGEPKGFPTPKNTSGEDEFKKSFEGLDQFMGGGKQ